MTQLANGARGAAPLIARKKSLTTSTIRSTAVPATSDRIVISRMYSSVSSCRYTPIDPSIANIGSAGNTEIVYSSHPCGCVCFTTEIAANSTTR